MLELTETKHACPVCGGIGSCIHAPPPQRALAYHNCKFCGSTWKETKFKLNT